MSNAHFALCIIRPHLRHSYYMLLCRSLPIFDKLCIRLFIFAHRCLSHDTDIVKFISHNCIKYGHSNSCTGKNVMFCMQRYKCNVEIVLVR